MTDLYAALFVACVGIPVAAVLAALQALERHLDRRHDNEGES